MCACKAPKDVIYFQGIDDLTPDELAEMSQAYTIKIENDDLLSINVTAWDPVAVTPFNPPVFAYSSQGEQPLIASESMYTYLVDEDGCINFPIIGKVHVAGLTRQEISKKLESKISKYVKDPLVNVQLLNFRIVLMGEFSRPGSYSVKRDRVSVLDAIGMAGDLPLTANRKNILVIRDNNGFKRNMSFGYLPAQTYSNRHIFYLKQNDIVYVEPIKTKQRARTSSDRQFTISLFSTVISSLSVIVAMVLSLTNK